MKLIRNALYAFVAFWVIVLLIGPYLGQASAQVFNPDRVDLTALEPNVMPPCVSDLGSIGTPQEGDPVKFALQNHTHCSKVRKDRVLIPIAQVADVTFGVPFKDGVVPRCAVTAETTLGDLSVVNAQMDGTPTSTGMRIRITRTGTVTVLGLSVLGVSIAQPTWAHYECLEP